MELLLPFVAAVLVGAGVFLVLSRALIRLILGVAFISYGVNIAILLAGEGSRRDAPPLLQLAGPYNDPLPQALVLTAIVISFATTALLLVLALRAYQVAGTDHVQELAERPDPVRPPVVYADPEHPSVSPEIGTAADVDALPSGLPAGEGGGPAGASPGGRRGAAPPQAGEDGEAPP